MQIECLWGLNLINFAATPERPGHSVPGIRPGHPSQGLCLWIGGLEEESIPEPEHCGSWHQSRIPPHSNWRSGSKWHGAWLWVCFEELRDLRVWVQRLAAQNCVLCFAVYICIKGTRICTISLTKPFLNPFPDGFKSIENSLNAAPHESAVKDGRQLEPQSVHTSAQHKRLPLLFSQSRVWSLSSYDQHTNLFRTLPCLNSVKPN